MDTYDGIFAMLDELGMPDLKEVFLRHRIQDMTLRYMDSEDELKKLLKEIEIPLGQCIPITKSWTKWRSRGNGVDSISNNYYPYRPPLIDAAVQASTSTTDKWTQTFNEDSKPYQHHSPGVIGSGFHNTINHNQYYGNMGFNNHITAPVNNNDGRPSYVPEIQAFQQPQIWPNPYNYQPASSGEDLGSSGWLDILNHLPNNGPIITSVISRDASPIPSPAIQDSVPLEENGLNSFDKHHHEVLDEREDMIIERSLVAEEKQQSYAAALKEKQMASAKALENKDSRPRSSSMPQQSPPPLASPPAISFNNHVPPPVIKPHHPPTRPKESHSTFNKCDEISLESGTSGVVGNNFKDIGSPTLRSYLEKLMASQEYIEATSKPKEEIHKGWLPIDGKHILSARKIQFKPMYIDDKGRMRHGVSVRGADKSEECSRHTVGKAPAYCTFAHSRIGDTLQFICIKCSREKSRYTYCQDKKDHKEFIFNLGPYKNIHGEPWKLTT